MENRAVLSVKQLHIGLSTPTGRRRIVNGVDFQLHKGKVLGLVGASGSGKTMTCRAIMGLLPETAVIERGTVELGARNLLQLSEKQMRKVRGKEIAYIMQNPLSAFHPTLTIGSQFVETIRAHFSLSRKEARERAAAFLAKAELPDPERLLDRYPFQLSGGMLQRVMIAIALALNPAVLIADEPTTALDAAHQKQLLMQMDRLCREQGTAMLLVSHDLGVIAYMADEVMVMNEGTIVEKAAAVDLFDRPQHPYTRRLLQANAGIRLG